MFFGGIVSGIILAEAQGDIINEITLNNLCKEITKTNYSTYNEIESNNLQKFVCTIKTQEKIEEEEKTIIIRKE